MSIAWILFMGSRQQDWSEEESLKDSGHNLRAAAQEGTYKQHVEQDSLRGIYLTALTASSEFYSDIIDALTESGGNAVVLDVELTDGRLAFFPEDKYLATLNPGSATLKDLKTMIRDLRRREIYVIARQVIFNDPYIARRKPEWRIKYKRGGLFDERWLDPSNEEVQAYNLAITRELVKMGFDEIQYDYIRFPAKNHAALDYAYDETMKERWEVINNFLKKASRITHEYGVKLGVDVYGSTVWGDTDWASLGQNIGEMAKTADVIYPMTYPFQVSPGYAGFKDPYGDPYPFVKTSIERFIKDAAGHAEVRTWIQGFPEKIPDFSPQFVREQVRATYDAGANDFIIWSPGNIYTNSWSSLNI